MTREEVMGLSPEEVLVKVAEKCGYSFRDEGQRYPNEEDWQKYKAVYIGKDSFVGLAKPDWIPVPDYCADLNVMAKVERTLTRDQREEFWETLREICEIDEGMDRHWSSNPIHATAEQRARAFLMV
jgi:hypothetical protein